MLYFKSKPYNFIFLKKIVYMYIYIYIYIFTFPTRTRFLIFFKNLVSALPYASAYPFPFPCNMFKRISMFNFLCYGLWFFLKRRLNSHSLLLCSKKYGHIPLIYFVMSQLL